jgi:predicted SnoaL-like aldol condensation-catalyzing enzyme
LTQQERKKIVEDFFQCIDDGKPKEGLHFFAPDCKQHNPYVVGGMDALLDLMASVQQQAEPEYSDPELSVKRIVADQDIIAAHTELLNSKSDPGKGGLRQVHIFRFGPDNKIIEYWDITQLVTPDQPNPANAF